MKNIIIILLLLLGINYCGKGQTPLDSLRLVIPFGHTNSIEDYNLNSDGSKMVTVGSDKKVILWDLKNCKEVFNFNGHTDLVASVDYSSDDLKIVTSSWDKTIKIWDAKNGKLLKTLIGHSELVEKVFFFKNDNSKVVSVCNSRGANEVFVWDLNTGQIIFNFVGEIAVLNKSENLIFVGNIYDNNVISYSLSSGQKMNEYLGLLNLDIQFKGTKSSIYCLSVNQSDTRLLAAGGDGAPIVWDIKTGKQLFKLEGHNCRIFSAEFSPNEKYILTAGDDDGTIKLWNAKNGKKLFQFKDTLNKSIRSAIFSSDNKYFAYVGSRSGSSSIHVFKTKNFQEISEIPIQGDYNSKISITNDPRTFAVSCKNTVCMYDFTSNKVIKELKGYTVNSTLNSMGTLPVKSSLENYIAGKNFIFKIDDPLSIQFIKDTLIHISEDGKTGWILKDRKEIHEVSLPYFEIKNIISLSLTSENWSNQTPVNFQLSDNYVFLEYNDSIFIHNRLNNKLVKKIAGKTLALSNDVDLIGYTTDYKINKVNDLEENSISVSRIESGETLFNLKADGYCPLISFSPDAKYFLSLSLNGYNNGFAKVYDIEKRNIIDSIGNEIPNATFTNINNVILYREELGYFEAFDGRNNLVIDIRDFINHQNIGILKGENPQLDWKNKYYSTISNDNIVVYLENGFSYQKSFAGHTNEITNILFNSELNKLVSSGLDNQIIIWDLEKGIEIYKLIVLENNNWIVRLPKSPYYMASKNAVNFLNVVTDKMGISEMEIYDSKFNRPDIVLKAIGEYFQK